LDLGFGRAYACGMETPHQAATWALSEFGSADLGHASRTKRSVRVAMSLVQNPAGSIPKVSEDSHQAKGTYRLLSNSEVDHDGLLSGHIARTVERCSGRGVVLVVQDTTTLSYNERTTVRGLGPVNDCAQSKGFLAHTALAICPKTGDVLGVLDQQVWVREDRKVTEGESNVARKKRPRESQHWPKAQHRVHALFSAMTEALRPRVVAVFDREGDIFEAFETIHDLGHSLVVRAIRNRLLEGEDEDKRYSMDVVGQGPIKAHYQVNVPSRPGRATRIAEMEIRALPVTLLPPRNRNRQGEPITLNMVLASEPQPPDGVEPLCWYLVTREPIETEAELLAIVQMYEMRWVIEELHMGIKTGCSTEDRQLETQHALANFLAFATVIAWRMLCLRQASRAAFPKPASAILTPSQLIVLCGLRPRLKSDCSATEAFRAIAVLGGFMGRKGDGNPGWRTLWAGFEKILMAERGYLLAKARSG
jgi:hypothetical protein